MTVTEPNLRLLLTAREAASALAISERKLGQIAQDGGIGVVRIGRCVRFDPADLAAWIARQKHSDAGC